MTVYLDNSATTKCLPAAADIMQKVLLEDYGNASSMHTKGAEAERYVREAAKKISRTLKCREDEIIFTSGGTESNNMAIIGRAMAVSKTGKHIVTTTIEHDSVKETVSFLAGNGYEVTRLGTDKNGVISLDELYGALRPDTVLVSIMMVNNEVGAVQPIKEAADIIRKKSPNAAFHVDAVQGYGKIRISPEREGIDLLSASGHKIHAPKGIGFLYVKKGTRLKPVVFGGGQQKGMRSGTVNVPGIAALGEAAEFVNTDLESKMDELNALKVWFAGELSAMDGVYINSDPAKTAPHIVSASFTGVRSEVLLHALEDKGIYVSAGSACSVHHKGKSAALTSMGLSDDRIGSALRFSFCSDTSREELQYTLEQLSELLPVLRRYKRR